MEAFKDHSRVQVCVEDGCERVIGSSGRPTPPSSLECAECSLQDEQTSGCPEGQRQPSGADGVWEEDHDAILRQRSTSCSPLLPPAVCRNPPPSLCA